MSVWLRQGRERIRWELLERWQRPPVVAPPAGSLRALVREAAGEPHRDGAPGPDGPARIQAALESGSRAAAFGERAARATRVCLAVPDHTRRGPWQEWLGATVRWLEERTPAAARRTVAIATGVHRPAIPPGLPIGPGWEVVANGEGGYGAHRALGATRAGTPVRLHPAWCDADLRVVLADVSFHYFAGFGGGRKLVFPGLGDPAGILANHRRCLDARGHLDPACVSGRLDGNPVHEDLLDAVALAPPDLLVQAHEPSPGEPARLLAGDWRDAHEAGCAEFLSGHMLEHTQRPDVLIADAGGHPRDASLLQAHKSLQHAARFLPSGAKLLLVAGLEEGSGSATLEGLMGLDPEELSRRAVAAYELHTHTALALRTVCRRIRVAVWCASDPERWRPAGIHPLHGPEEALQWLEDGGRPRAWGWIPRAEEFLPRLVGRPERAAEPSPTESGTTQEGRTS